MIYIRYKRGLKRLAKMASNLLFHIQTCSKIFSENFEKMKRNITIEKSSKSHEKTTPVSQCYLPSEPSPYHFNSIYREVTHIAAVFALL